MRWSEVGGGTTYTDDTLLITFATQWLATSISTYTQAPEEPPVVATNSFKTDESSKFWSKEVFFLDVHNTQPWPLQHCVFLIL